MKRTLIFALLFIFFSSTAWCMDIKLKFVNKSEDTKNSNIVIFQKNVAENFSVVRTPKSGPHKSHRSEGTNMTIKRGTSSKK